MNTQTHDTQIFSAMVEILISSGLGEEVYGFTKNHHQTRYGRTCIGNEPDGVL